MEQQNLPSGAAGTKEKKAKAGGNLLLWQMILTGLVLVGVLVCRYAVPQVYRQMEQAYALYFEQDDLSPNLARFAGSVLDYFSVASYAEKAAPDYASNAAYQPKQDFCAPVTGYTVSSEYGWRTHPVTKKQTFHCGMDLACAEGTPVKAAMSGTVEYTLYSESGGNSMRIRHTDGVETAYCHMQYLFVRAGEQVTAGQIVGTAGSTGNATGPHLHFALLYNDIYYDPSDALKGA